MTVETTAEPITEPETLTPVLRQVLLLRVAGASTTEIARELGVNVSTARTYTKRAYRTNVVTMIDRVTGRPVRGARLAYVLGLLHGGVPLAELPVRLRRLDDSAHTSWRVRRTGTCPVSPQSARSSDAADLTCDTDRDDCCAA